MEPESRLADLVGLFYEAAFAPARWNEAAGQLARHFAANVAGIMVPPPFDGGPPLPISIVGVPEAAKGAYLA